MVGRTLPLDFGPPKAAAPPAPATPPPASEPVAKVAPTPLSPLVSPPVASAPVVSPPPRVAAPAPSVAAPASAPAPRAAPEPPRAFTVGELGRVIRGALDAGFALPVWVEGEVTGCRPAPSGHLYFCLKDEAEDASIDLAMYKTSITPRARALLKDGARVRVRGRPTFWSPRGRLQFIADRAEATGKGALLEALERLKEKLAGEGLFAATRKRPLPEEPRAVGVVTSAGGAVIHDICKVAFRRGGARILLSPALVQGAGAAGSILRALQLLQRVPEVDVIIVGRGGGSSDDLSAFNDEALVRAVAACRVPVVSAVGHEVDVTLTDFAADARAATPSQAAELTVADRRARRERLREVEMRLQRAIRARLTEGGATLLRLQGEIDDPRLAIASQQQRLDERLARMSSAMERGVSVRRERLARASHALTTLHPRSVVARERIDLGRLEARLTAVTRATVARRAGSLEALAAGLDAMSPLKVLGRGYAVATRSDGRALRDAVDVVVGDRITLRVRRARVVADVVSSTPEEDAQ